MEPEPMHSEARAILWGMAIVAGLLAVVAICVVTYQIQDLYANPTQRVKLKIEVEK